ncbi:MAG: SET domain-containing protein [Negativicutes bacterium]|nr:SET domain-containing protein [Negativicutes bacterium]
MYRARKERPTLQEANGHDALLLDPPPGSEAPAREAERSGGWRLGTLHNSSGASRPIFCKYGGDRIENHDPDFGPYVLELKDTDPYVYMDGKRSSKRIGAFANHPPHGRPANALFDKLPDLSDGTVVAKRPIAAGREIFVNYGGDYWNGGLKKQAPKRLNDDEVEEELDRVMALLPEGVQLALPAYQRRRRNEGRQAAVLSDAWRARERRRQLAEAQAALVRQRKKAPAPQPARQRRPHRE